jgi:hypothetical protein
MADIAKGDRVVEVTRASGRGGAPARDPGEEDEQAELDF